MRLIRKFACVFCLSFGVLIATCTNKKEQTPEGPAAAVQTKAYQGRGTVKGFDPKVPMIELDHEDIKGLMPAMEMQFHIKDKALLEGLSVGDRVEFTIESGVGGLRIVAIHKV